MDEDRRTAEEWLEHPLFAGVEVIDPDGWRKRNVDWNETVTVSEFEMMLIDSTCKLPRSFFDARTL